jgi:hypothetical protein
MRACSKAAISDQTALMERRQRLAKRIENFHAKVDLMSPDLDWDEVHPQHLQDLGKEEQEEQGEEGSWLQEREEEEWIEEADEIEVAERITLFLPSYLEPADRERLGFEELAKQELELRKGQANDSLEALRVALGHKSLLFRSSVS